MTPDTRALWELVDEVDVAYVEAACDGPMSRQAWLRIKAILERPVVVGDDWFQRAHVTQKKWNAMLRVVRSAKEIGDYLAEFGTLEGIPEIFDALYRSLDACNDACQENS